MCVHVKEEMGIAVTLDMLKSYLDVTSVFSTGKQLLHMEGSLRSNFSNEKIELQCHKRAGTTALTVFKINIL